MNYTTAAAILAARFERNSSGEETELLAERILARNPPESLVAAARTRGHDVMVQLWEFDDRPDDADALENAVGRAMGPGWVVFIGINNMSDDPPDGFAMYAALNQDPGARGHSCN